MFRKQKSTSKAVEISGIGLFSGDRTKITILPGSIDSGILFKRVDIKDSHIMPASLDYILPSVRRTSIGVDGCSVDMVEHLMSALFALEIDNALIEVNGRELPSVDGSSLPFVKLLREACIKEQDGIVKINELKDPLFHSDGRKCIIALPCNCIKFSYLLNYENRICQHFTFSTEENYDDLVAPARTYVFESEIKRLLSSGFVKGGSEKNVAIVNDNGSVSGARFKNEMARHKILDLIGDIAILRTRYLAHIIGIGSGHNLNIGFAKKLRQIKE